jgi:hypothetical protein
MTPKPVPQIFLPTPPERWDRSYVSRLLETIRQNFGRCLSKETANESILLQSPNGSVFKITVTDAGALTATQVVT